MLLAAGLTLGCASWLRSEQDEARLDLYRQNAVNYYDAGRYSQALDQADRALAMDDDLDDMHLVRGMAMVKIGKAAGDPAVVDRAIEIFERLQGGGLTGWWRDEPAYQVHHAAGRARLARALMRDPAIAMLERRMQSEFLGPAERAAEADRLADERAARESELAAAERDLRRVLPNPRADTAYVRIDLALTLNSLGGRGAEVIEQGNTAIEQLAQSNRYWRNIQANANAGGPQKVNAELKIEQNLQKEAMLRDLLATVRFNQGDIDGYLAELEAMESRQLMTAVQHYNRAAVWEQRGRLDLAIADLQAFLRLRAQHLKYEEDDKADEVFRRIDELRARIPRTGAGGR